jgi:hypothetical protein
MRKRTKCGVTCSFSKVKTSGIKQQGPVPVTEEHRVWLYFVENEAEKECNQVQLLNAKNAPISKPGHPGKATGTASHKAIRCRIKGGQALELAVIQ